MKNLHSFFNIRLFSIILIIAAIIVPFVLFFAGYYEIEASEKDNFLNFLVKYFLEKECPNFFPMRPNFIQILFLKVLVNMLWLLTPGRQPVQCQ